MAREPRFPTVSRICAFASLGVLAPGAALGDEPPAPRGLMFRGGLASGLSVRSEDQSIGTSSVDAEGTAAPYLHLGVAVGTGGPGLGWGVGLLSGSESYALEGKDLAGMTSSTKVRAMGHILAGGLRIGGHGPYAEVGPALAIGSLSHFDGAALPALHADSATWGAAGGELLGGWDAGGWVAADVRAVATPVALFADAGGKVTRLLADASLSIGPPSPGRLGLAGVLSYGFDRTTSTGGFRTTQTAHRIALGLELRMGPPAPPVGGAGPLPTPTPTPEPALARGAVRGTVLWEDGNAAAAGVTVEAGGVTATTDAAGAFVLEGVPGGRARLHATAPGARALEAPVDVPAGGEAQVNLVVHRFVGPGRIVGVLLAADAKNPKGTVPVADVPVVVAGGKPVRSAPDGTFTAPSVGPGPVELVVKAEGWKTVEEVVQVPAEADAKVSLTLVRVGSKAQATVRGLVRSASGEPVAARLRIPELKLEAKASAQDGTFQMRVPGGRYTMWIEADGFVAQKKTVEVAEGDQAIFNVDLQPKR